MKVRTIWKKLDKGEFFQVGAFHQKEGVFLMKGNLTSVVLSLLALFLTGCGDKSERPVQSFRGQLLIAEGKNLKLNSTRSGQALDVLQGQAELYIYTNSVVLQNPFGSFSFSFPNGMDERLRSLTNFSNISQEPTKLLDGTQSRQPVDVFGFKASKKTGTNDLSKKELRYVGSTPGMSSISMGEYSIPNLSYTDNYQSRVVQVREEIGISTYRFDFRDLFSGERLGTFIVEVPETNSTVLKISSDWK
jgi:hypothetical protein